VNSKHLKQELKPWPRNSTDNTQMEQRVARCGYPLLNVWKDDATVRLLLQYGDESTEDDEANFQPAANAVLRQWNALSQPGELPSNSSTNLNLGVSREEQLHIVCVERHDVFVCSPDSRILAPGGHVRRYDWSLSISRPSGR